MNKIVEKWRIFKCSVSKDSNSAGALLFENEYLEPVVNEKECLIQQSHSSSSSNQYNILKRSNKTLTFGFQRESSRKKLKKEKKVEKQPSQDSNYYSEPEREFEFEAEKHHHYEEIDENWDYSEEDLLVDTGREKISDSKNNLTLEIFDTETIEADLGRNTTLRGSSKNASNKKAQFTCLTEIKPLNLFKTQADGIIWYYNLLFDTMLYHLQCNKKLSSQDCKTRVNMVNAHLLYVKNLYEVRIALSKQLKYSLSSVHPCIIALALLLDSDAVRICDSHTCSFDDYVYLFSTKIKLCSWKAKYYIVLKKPKQSSFDRLNLIEELMSCHKLINDKAIL